MPQIDLPHVLHTFDALDDRGRRILNVATDLPTKPGTHGFDAEALYMLNKALSKLLDPRKGYDQFILHSKDNVQSLIS
jgi:hypothetical protein